MNLYCIEDSLQQLAEMRTQAIEDGDAEAEKAIDHEIAAYLTREAEKAASFAGLILARQDLVANAKRAIERDTAILRAAEADVDRLKAIALEVMQRFNVKEIKDKRTGHGLKRQGNGGKQPLELPEWPKNKDGSYKLVPHTLGDKHRVPVRFTALPDTEEIREALKRGESIPGAKLLELGEHVRVL